ncbi:MAG: bifunctional pyr operon transcriptional regulator/uracil phosphoribosyltransferase PyrR [Verrucomicrobiae bacterium]|nr:bifunctional pyr operon transcriptional regulator/uracil phosphoribosyltransferase PyrR [Verrucomicrobiae bacterium]MCX7914812.1 bifunctional pyr operon transcriptional regulator/uracil phosphoribosyltransferase PyrR [Verrucomicrobiae bacterium]MDW8344164.1 bifunctional pyr operon transcriptional regulator/uracil phosphoribosyltransferase PyrR [Verrucomicrobiae bacterium]
MNPVVIMDAAAIDRSITRMAHEIVEQNPSAELAFVGIHTHGVPLAQRLARKVQSICGREFPVGSLDITMHRDDLDLRRDLPRVSASHIPWDVNGREVVLVDDVLFTGRSVRAAMDALIDLGRPRRILLAVLVDRGHRELPIRADFVGKNIPTALTERVRVRLREVDQVDEVVVEK